MKKKKLRSRLSVVFKLGLNPGKCFMVAARPLAQSHHRSPFDFQTVKMLKSHNHLDVDMAALKKGEVDLGTSMYSSSYPNSH
jgi:hypothetical protein